MISFLFPAPFHSWCYVYNHNVCNHVMYLIYEWNTVKYQIIAGAFICFNHLTDQAFIWDRRLIPSSQKSGMKMSQTSPASRWILWHPSASEVVAAEETIHPTRMFISGSSLVLLLPPTGSLVLLLSSSDRRWSSVRFFQQPLTLLGSTDKRLAAASLEFSSENFTTESLNFKSYFFFFFFFFFAAPEPWRSSMWYWLTESSTNIWKRRRRKMCSVTGHVFFHDFLFGNTFPSCARTFLELIIVTVKTRLTNKQLRETKTASNQWLTAIKPVLFVPVHFLTSWASHVPFLLLSLPG